MAKRGLFGMARRWRLRVQQRPPSRYAHMLANLGIALLLLGAVLVTAYVARQR